MPDSITTKDLRTLELSVEKATRYIVANQIKNGGIPWFADNKLDPWDHTEALMALIISNQTNAWHKGFKWLAENQNSDGSWFANYYSSEEMSSTYIETNFVAYPATGLWHYYLCTQDASTLKYFYPTIEKAINYILRHQHKEGDIQWAVADHNNSHTESPPKDALVTACSSILRSLECAISIAETLSQPCDSWRQSYLSLYGTLKNKPWRFDRTWESKERFSMDWFYPILAGIYGKSEAQLRLDQRWNIFVEPEIGCRCVSDEPWVTVAESCELCLALIASGRKKEAAKILISLTRWQDKDGGFWTGYNFRDNNIWPQEKTTWTAAAFIIASDALLELSQGSHLFTQPSSII